MKGIKGLLTFLLGVFWASMWWATAWLAKAKGDLVIVPLLLGGATTFTLFCWAIQWLAENWE